jgi:hypothetical protein
MRYAYRFAVLGVTSLALVGACGRTASDAANSAHSNEDGAARDAAANEPTNSDRDAAFNSNEEAGTGDAANERIDEEPLDPLPAPQGSLVYTSSHAMGRLTYVSEDGESRPLSPARGAGYAGLEGRASIHAVSPNQRWVLLCMHSPAASGDNVSLYAVATDGTHADRALFLLDSCPEATFSQDGAELILSQEEGLLHLAADPPDPNTLTLLAPTTGAMEVCETDDGWAFFDQNAQGATSLFIANLGDSTKEIALSTEPEWGGISRCAGDYLIASRQDRALYRVSLADGSDTRITLPDTSFALRALIHAEDEGEGRLIGYVRFDDGTAQSWSFRLDGSNADSPDILIDLYFYDVLALPSTQRFFLRDYGVLYEIPWDGSYEGDYISTRSDTRPIAASQDERYLFECYQSALRRLDLQAETPTWEPYDDPLPELFGPHPRVHTTDFMYFLCGDKTLPVPGATRQSEILDNGRLERSAEVLTHDALYLRTPEGEHHRISVEHDFALGRTFFPQGFEQVLYDVPLAEESGMEDGEENRLIRGSARLNGLDRRNESLLIDEGLEFVNTVGETPLYRRITDDFIDYLAPQAGSGGRLVALALGVSRDFWPLVTHDGLVLVREGGIWFFPINGSEPTLLLAREATIGYDLLFDERREQLLVTTDNQLLAVGWDGSEADTPRVLLDALPEDFFHLGGLFGENVTFYTYQVPERPGAIGFDPKELFRVALDGSQRGGAILFEDQEVFLDYGNNQLTPTVSQDGKWVLGREEDSLMLFPVPPHEAAPVRIGNAPVSPLYARVPNADIALIWTIDGLWSIPLSAEVLQSGGALLLSEELEQTHRSELLWLNDKKSFLLTCRYGEAGDSLIQVNIEPTSDDRIEVISSGILGGPTLEAASPDGSWFVFNRGDPSRGLMGYRPGEEPFALSSETDTNERLVGWVR